MISKYFKISNGTLGFGLEEEEIENDLYLNLCKKDLNNDNKLTFKNRKVELFPWNPKPNMLHLDGVGCIVLDGVVLTEVSSGNKVIANVDRNSPYYYVSKLLGSKLTYSDISVVVNNELDELLSATGLEITKIKDMPQIMVSTTELGFDPTVVYKYESDIMVAVSNDAIGLKYSWSDAYYVVERKSNEPVIPLLDYLGYRAGILFTYEGKIIQIESEDN